MKRTPELYFPIETASDRSFMRACGVRTPNPDQPAASNDWRLFTGVIFALIITGIFALAIYGACQLLEAF
jgi:hypothetical protein